MSEREREREFRGRRGDEFLCDGAEENGEREGGYAVEELKMDVCLRLSIRRECLSVISV